MRRLAVLFLALVLSGCAGSAGFGPAVNAKEQLLMEVLSAPTAICTALQMQNIQAALQLKAILTAPTVSLPVSVMTPPVVQPAPPVVTPIPMPTPAPPGPIPPPKPVPVQP